jgi:hypothetical protein
MIVVIILLAVVLCILIGFAAGQMQDLRDSKGMIMAQRSSIERLIRENEGLRRGGVAQ